MFEKVYNLLDKAESLDEDTAWFLSIDSDVKDRIIKLNTIDQLHNRGVDALNESLGEYSPFTVEEKKAKGHRFVNITLRNEGDFYRSFNIEVRIDKIIIDANPVKDDSNLIEDFGEHIIGLTDENTRQISEMVLERILTYIKKELNIAA